MACCKINLGVAGAVADCNLSILSGAKSLLIAPICHVLSVVEDACPDKVISAITMDDDPIANPATGDVEHLFYAFNTKDQGLKFDFDHQHDAETSVVTYNETVTAEIDVKTASAFCAIDALFGKEIAIIMKEAGDDGQYLIAGLGGGLFLQQNLGTTGQRKTDSNFTTLTITGELDSRWLYIFDTDAATTQALIDGISA